MQKFISRLGLGFAAGILATAFAALGFGFLSVALFLAVREVSTSAMAALVTGLADFTLVGLIALILAIMFRRRSAPSDQPHVMSQPEIAAEIGKLLGSQTTTWVKDHAKSATAVALIAGFVVGASPELRGTLRDVFKQSDDG